MSVEKLEGAFALAAQKAKTSKIKLPPDVRLQFYAYYKQATLGDLSLFNVQVERNIVGTLKFNAWMQLKGTSKTFAKKKYIELVENHINKK